LAAALLVCALAAGLWSPSLLKAQARPGLKVEVCLCRRMMARFLCKAPSEFELLGRQATGAYVFNVFYASRYTNFLCRVGGSMVRVNSPDLLRKSGAMLFEYNPDTGCATGRYKNSQCTVYGPKVRCCQESAKEGKQRKEEEQFWTRPVPEGLPPPTPPSEKQPGGGSQEGSPEEGPSQ
jgi:hypothetical protein